MTPDKFMIETFTGRVFDIQNPSSDMVCLDDISHALSNTCRYNGHCNRFYSVAEHSVHVAQFIHTLGFSDHVAFAALMHDACETYTGDFPSPFKWAIPELKTIEDSVQRAIHAHFEIDPRYYNHKVIDDTDKRIVVDERKMLMKPPTVPWAIDHLRPLGIQIRCWTPDWAEKEFITLFQGLDATRNSVGVCKTNN